MRHFNVVLAIALSLASLAGCVWSAPLLEEWNAGDAGVTFAVAAPLSFVWRLASKLVPHPLLEHRLVQTCADCRPYWTTELGKHALFMRGVKYIDITGDFTRGPAYTALVAEQQRKQGTNDVPLPHRVAYEKQLKAVFASINETGPRAHLTKFTSFRTRYYRSDTGRQSQAWLLDTVRQLASTRTDLNISVSEWPHSWGQNSIILHVPGADKKANEEQGVTIVGAHQDSTGFLPFLPAPGADDDGSGTVTLLESLRVLLASEHRWAPKTDVEFHWYSAEEGGLLGSQDVVRGYVERHAKVKAMLQQDMTAFVKQGTEERVGLPTDFVDDKLRTFVQTLVKAYLDIPAVDTKLGYAASDHASWNKAGYRSVFAIEAPFEDCNLQRIHTTRDTFDHPEFSFSHLLKFVRLTSAFVVELAGWQA